MRRVLSFASLRPWVRFFRHEILGSVGLAALSVVAAGLEATISIGLASFVARDAPTAAGRAVTLLLLAILARGTLQIVIAQSSIAVLERWRWRLRNHLVDRVFADLSEASLVDAESRLADGHHKAASFVYQAAGLFPQLALAFSASAILLWLSWGKSLLVLSVLAITASWAVALTRRQSRRYVPPLRDLHREFHRHLVRVLRNSTAVRAYGTDRREYETLLNVVRASAALSEKLQRGVQAIGIVPGLGLSLVLVAGIVQAPADRRAALFAFGLLAIRLGTILGSMAKSAAHLQATYPFFRDAIGDVEREARREYGPEETFAESRPPTVEFVGVSYRYPNTLVPAVEDVHWHVPSGELAVVEGPSGVGKSTLLALALGLLTPTSGVVLIDGIPAHRYWHGNRRRVAYAGAEPMIVAGSIRENLCYGNDERLDDGSLVEVLSAVGLSDWLATRADGLDFLVGENGSGLSQGQRQRLVLARNLLRRPTFVVLDEPVAALDERSADAYLATVRQWSGRATIVIAAHRAPPALSSPIRLPLEAVSTLVRSHRASEQSA